MTISTLSDDSLSINRQTARCFAVLLLAALTGCGQLGLEPDDPNTASESNAVTAPDGDRTAAVLDGREISVAEIDEYLKNAFLEGLLSQPPTAIYEARNKGIQEMIQKQVIEAAAAERGITPQELFDEVIAEATPPSIEEVTAWYSENQSRLRGARLEDVSSNIEELLLKEKQGEAWGAFISPRIEALDMKIVLEAPRQDLEATRLVRGTVDAPVTIMTFSDYQCPYCIRSEPVLAEVLARYPDQVRIVHRHFPLDSIHPFARPAAEASMCADEQGKFWEYHDAIFARNGKLSEASFAEIGSELGLDTDALSVCLAEHRYADFVQQDFEVGRAAGVTGTPAFFVNGLALTGSRDADALSRIVESELSRIEMN